MTNATPAPRHNTASRLGIGSDTTARYNGVRDIRSEEERDKVGRWDVRLDYIIIILLSKGCGHQLVAMFTHSHSVCG